MKLDGDFTIDAPRAAVWQAIRDPALMARCVPGCESAEQIDARRYRAVIATRLGPVSARFHMVIEIEEEVEPEFVRASATGEEGSRASMLTSRNTLSLQEAGPNRTGVSWTADVNITGRLGKYGLGLMRKKVESLSEEFVKTFAGRVATGAAAR